MLKRIALILVAIVCLLALTPRARSQQVGQSVVIKAWCLSERAARELAAVTALENDAGYRRAMQDPGLECYDVRYHPVRPRRVVIVYRVFGLTRVDGEQFDFWRVRGPGQRYDYTWTRTGRGI